MTEGFGTLLRRHRLAASLTQEALAERAAVSATAVAALERGRRRAPRLSTVRQLARALDLSPEAVAELARAADADAQTEATVAPAVTTTVDAEPSPGAPPRAERARTWRTRFVGRADELAQLRRAWSDRQRLVVIAGEAGIGKTRLTSALAEELARSGVAIAWGRGSEEGLGAYAPFVEVARQIVTAADPARLASAVGGRGELTRLVPDIETRVGPLPPVTVAEAGTEQRLLFEAVGALIAGCAPVVVVLDDLHWADRASIALLHYLVRDEALTDVMVVATARDSELDPAVAGLLADLGRHAPTLRVDLHPLDDDGLAALVGDVVGASVGNEVVRYIADATDGNPFFAEEMTVQLIDTGALVDVEHGAVLRTGADSGAVPDRVREMLHRRVLALGRETQDLLATASIIGRQFDLRIAGPAAALDGLRLADAVDDALLSGLVDETGPGRLAFSHALVQRAVGERLSSARAAVIHRRVAEAIEAGAVDADAAAVQDLARHWAAVAVVDPSVATTAATWAVRAGDAALAAAAADEAIARYEQASELWSAASRGHADALVRLGDALQYRGRADEADGRYRQALHVAAALDDPALEARAAIGLGRRYPYWESDSDRIGALEHALATLKDEPDHDALRLTIMGLLVTQMINGFRAEEAARRDELVDALAAEADNPETSDATLSHLGKTRVYDWYEDPVRLDRVARRVADVGERRNDLRVIAVARFAIGLAALDRGEMDDLRVAADHYDAVARQLDDPREHSQAATVRATIAFVEGRYDDSESLSNDALTFGRASGDYNAELVFYAQGLLRAVDQGLAAAVLPLLVDTDDYQQIPSFTAGTALCAAVGGEPELARELVERLVRAGLDGSPRGADRLAPTAFLAHTTASLGLVEFAERLLAALLGQPCTAVRVGPLIGWWGPVDHHAGALLRLLGRLDEAEAHLRHALELETRMGARPFLARTRGELATVLELRGASGADALRSAALAEADALGAAGIAAEIGATDS
ncbi:MAG TPA: AAA family ATPase [Acidimicrobiia bacterium]|nr:AAA family ATPase [Acidimicrobiia bacterium]